MLKVQNGRLLMTRTATPEQPRVWGWVYLALIIGIIGWSIWRGEQHAHQMAAYREQTRPARELADHIDRRGGLYMTINSLGQIVEWTKAGERLTGYTSAEILGSNLTALLPESMREKHQVAFERATKHWPVQDLHIHCDVLTKAGTTVPVSLFVWRMEDGERYSAVVWRRKS